MNARDTSRNKVGAGKSIVNRHERYFKRGSLMFIEGESSTEMFIIRSGCIRILKQEGENTIELAQLGPGSVLGELSLLDHQPRSATAQVLDDTSVTVIDEELFTRTLQNIPGWLENMIQLVVRRLRDTMKKTGDDVIVKSIGGVIQIMLLISAAEEKRKRENAELRVSTVKEQVMAVIGLGGVEIEQIFLHLILKELIHIRKNPAGQEYIAFNDRSVLQLYMQYLRVHLRGGTLIGEAFTEEVYTLAGVILEAGERNGAILDGKMVSIGEQQIEIELARSGHDRFINADAREQLLQSKLLVPRDAATGTRHGHHTRSVFLYNPAVLRDILLLKKWLPVFREDVQL